VTPVNSLGAKWQGRRKSLLTPVAIANAVPMR